MTLTDNGFATAADLLGVADDPLGLFGTDTKWAAYLFPALNAKELYFRERDYLVDQGEVKIVDEFTGRVMEGRGGTAACTKRSRRKNESTSNPSR